MPIETAALISDLNASYPVSTDDIGFSGDHIRLTKSAIKTTFPAITGTVTASHGDLNAAGLAFHNAGTAFVVANGTLAAGRVKLDGIGGAGDIDLVNTGTANGASSFAITTYDSANATPWTVLSATRDGTVTALAALNAPVLQQSGTPLVPRGVITLWYGALNALPTGWVLCDGTNGTPDLRDKFIVGAGTSYAALQTGGATSATATTTAAGSHNHGAATGTAGGHTHGVSLDTQGSHSHGGVTQAHALTLAEIPYHDHGLGGITVLGQGGSPGGGGGSFVSDTPFQGQGSNNGHLHGIYADGAHTHNATVTSVGDHSHFISTASDHAHSVTVATVPPFVALAYIMKS